MNSYFNDSFSSNYATWGLRNLHLPHCRGRCNLFKCKFTSSSMMHKKSKRKSDKNYPIINSIRKIAVISDRQSMKQTALTPTVTVVPDISHDSSADVDPQLVSTKSTLNLVSPIHHSGIPKGVQECPKMIIFKNISLYIYISYSWPNC